MNLTEPQAGLRPQRAEVAAPSRPATAPTASSAHKIFITYGEHDFTDNIVHLVLARLPDAPPGTRGLSLFLVPKFLVDADGSARRAQRRLLRRHRAQARHPWLADLHHDLWRRLRQGPRAGRRRLAGRRGESRPRLHVHDDEQCPPRGRHPGRGGGRAATQKALAYANERRQGKAAGYARATAWRRSSITPTSQRDALDHAGADQRGARHLLCAAPMPSTWRMPATAMRTAPLAGARQSADADRQGVRHRYRRRGRLARRAGAWRHGLHRGDRRGRALSRRPHRADLRGHQRHPGDRPRHPQAAASRAASMCSAIIAELAERVAAIRTVQSAAASGMPPRRSTGRWPTCSRRRTSCRTALAEGRSRAGAGRRHALSQAVRADGRRPPISPRRACRSRRRSRIALCRFFADNLLGETAALKRAGHRRQRQPCRGRRVADRLNASTGSIA